jgi:hypothetical protein
MAPVRSAVRSSRTVSFVNPLRVGPGGNGEVLRLPALIEISSRFDNVHTSDGIVPVIPDMCPIIRSRRRKRFPISVGKVPVKKLPESEMYSGIDRKAENDELLDMNRRKMKKQQAKGLT